MHRMTLLIPLILTPMVPVVAQSAADSAAIRATAADYVMGWYDGDTTRMARSVHPDLAKRNVRTPATGLSQVRTMTATVLVGATAGRAAQPQPADRRLMEITILTIHKNTAAVRVDSYDFVDLVHMGQVDGRWVIINDLWSNRQ
jgi:hypothetical protein